MIMGIHMKTKEMQVDIQHTRNLGSLNKSNDNMIQILLYIQC